jgi:hypothetical protein
MRRVLEMRYRVGGAVLAAALGASAAVPESAEGRAVAQAARPVPVHGTLQGGTGVAAPGFSITVAVGPGGVTATCDAGCAWREVAAAYVDGVYHLTGEGISSRSPLRGGRCRPRPVPLLRGAAHGWHHPVRSVRERVCLAIGARGVHHAGEADGYRGRAGTSDQAVSSACPPG